jgi:hypothetical protein
MGFSHAPCTPSPTHSYSFHYAILSPFLRRGLIKPKACKSPKLDFSPPYMITSFPYEPD